MHAAFNASTDVYYTTFNRVSELSSYVAELSAAFVIALLLYGFAIKAKLAGRLADGDVSTA
jgi:hypothetical protein